MRFARFLHAFSTPDPRSHPTRRTRVFGCTQGRHWGARRAIGIGRPLCLQKEGKCRPGSPHKVRTTRRKHAFSGLFCAFFAHILRVFCMHFRHSIPGLIRRGGREFSTSSGQAPGRRAHDWKRSSYMPTKKEGKCRPAGLQTEGLSANSQESRFAGRYKTVKVGLEATIKCAKLRKIDCFCDL
jgi:hypothetical protein